MHEITNLTNSPFDLENADGVIRLPAMGKVSGVFTPEYLAALEGCGLYSIQAINRKAPKTSPLDHDRNGKPCGLARSCLNPRMMITGPQPVFPPSKPCRASPARP
jgi:hypothetical protein